VHPQLLRLIHIEPTEKQNTELTQPSPIAESIQMSLGMPPSHSDAFRNWTRGGLIKGVWGRKSPNGKQGMNE